MIGPCNNLSENTFTDDQLSNANFGSFCDIMQFTIAHLVSEASKITITHDSRPDPMKSNIVDAWKNLMRSFFLFGKLSHEKNTSKQWYIYLQKKT